MRSTRKKLSSSEIQKRLNKVSEWNVHSKQTELSKTFVFSNFVNGLAFIAKIAVHAEILNHHPELLLNYGSVKVTISTHEVKGLTQLDFDLAKKIDSIRIQS